MAFKLSAITWSHHYSYELKKIDDAGLIDLYAKEGLGGIEFILEHLNSSEREHLLKLKKRATDAGLSITCISPGNSFGKKKAEDEQGQIDYVKKGVDIAEIMGCANVRVFAGWPDGSKEEMWPKAVDSMKICAKYAETKGITLAVEPHNGGGYLPDSKSTLKFLSDVNSPFVKLNLDTGNFLGHDKDIYEALAKTVKHATYCHVKIHSITEAGETSDFDIDKTIKVLSEGNYRGWLAVEYEGQEFIKGEKEEKAENELGYFKYAVKKIKDAVKKHY